MREFCEVCSDDFKVLFFDYSANKNTNTRNEYISYINLLCNYIGKDFLDITTEDAQKYLNYMNSKRSDQKLTRKTITVRLACYNTVAQYISDKEEGYINPFSRLTRPEVSNEFDPNRIPTMSDLDTLMGEAKKDPQDFLILALASRVGLSATSILQLSTNSIIIDGDSIHLHFEPKGDFNGDSYVKLPEDVRDVLKLYISSKGLDLSQKTSLFKNRWGNPLTIQNIDQLVKKLTTKCGLEEYTLKDFRNRAILEMANAGATKEQLEEYTGLKSMRLEKFFFNKSLVDGTCPAELVNYRIIVN